MKIAKRRASAPLAYLAAIDPMAGIDSRDAILVLEPGKGRNP